MSISESFTISFDMDDTEDALLSVISRKDNKMEYVGVFRGIEAIQLYEKLTNHLINERGL